MKVHTSAPVKVRKMRIRKGFTLIEILVVIGIIAVLATVVLVAVNPARQFKLARDSQRTSNVNAILNAIHQNMAEHKGTFTCLGAPQSIPTDITSIKHSDTPGDPGDISHCIVPDYISALPFDPSIVGANFNSIDEYDIGYSFIADGSGRVTVSAVGEIATEIKVTR